MIIVDDKKLDIYKGMIVQTCRFGSAPYSRRHLMISSLSAVLAAQCRGDTPSGPVLFGSVDGMIRFLLKDLKG